MTIDAIWSTRGLFAFVPGTTLDVLFNLLDKSNKYWLSHFIGCNYQIGLSLLIVVRSLVETAEPQHAANLKIISQNYLNTQEHFNAKKE
jgi:hypothetical protein